MKLDRRIFLILAALGALLGAALVALERANLSPEAKGTVRRWLLTGFGIAAAVALGVVALLSAPWWVAAAGAGVALVTTGAYNLAAGLTGLPEVPAGGSIDGDPAANRPDPCEVGPYWWNGVYHACNR